MLKGVAKAGGNDPQDHYGIVVALSNLSKTLSGAEEDSTFAAAADAGATMLRISRMIVYINDENGDLVTCGSVGVLSSSLDIFEVAHEVAAATLGSASPMIYPNSSIPNNEIVAHLKKVNLSSALGVPMRVGKINVGAIVALGSKARIFTQADIDLLHIVASQTALVVWKTKNQHLPPESISEDQDTLIQLADRKIQELSLVNRVSAAVSSTLNLEKLLDIALEQSMMSIGADVGSLMLINKDTNKLEIVASRGLAEKWVKKTSVKIGSSISGWVAEHGESALINNARTDHRFNMPLFRDQIHSAAAIPLKARGAVIGVLNISTRKPDRVFDERDLQLLGTVANQMAAAIENARLYDRVNRRTKQLDSLLQISRTVTSTLNLDDVMHQLCDEICQVFALDVCTLLLLDELSERFRFGHGCGLKTRRKYIYYDLSSPFALRVRRTGSKLLVKNIDASKALRTDISKNEGLKSAICIPIKHHGRLVAVITGFSREQRSLAQSQMDIIRPLAELAGIALHNARKYRQKYKLAAILQERLMPSLIPEVSGLDIGHKFLPARGVGGDYYDFIKFSESKIGIIVGDVAGSDVEAAEYTTMGKYVLRAYAKDYPSAADVLAKTNDMVCEDTRTEMFISLFYGIVDVECGKLRYASAGCEPAVLYKAKTKTVTSLAAEGMLLGIKRGTTYVEQEVDIEPGDILLMHTDGLPEAGVGNERFGTQRVYEIVRENVKGSAQTMVDNLYGALIEFGHGRISDDVAMVAVKVL